MQLSTAIRLGSMMKPQAFGDLWKNGGLASCALGAAYDAFGYSVQNLDGLPPAILLQLDEPVRCHLCGLTFLLANGITHLNDDHRWTREQIADWVASVERLTQPQADAAVDPALADLGRTSTRDRVGVS